MLFRNKYFLIVVFALGLSACKKWDDHIAVTNQDLTQNLLQAIASNSNLSTFNQYIKQTGVDTLLQSSKDFTVWAPTNAALQTLDPTIVNDPVKLKSFVLNHISNQAYFTRDVQTAPLRLPMLSGKYNTFGAGKFEDANLLSTDKYVSNGVLHTIDKPMLVLPNVWDFITSTATQYAQNGYIASLNYNDFDPTLATVDSINSTTGLPVYHPGTGVVVKNKFNEKILNLKNEAKQYTYFVIADANFKVESDSLLKYYTSSTMPADSLAKWNEVKDLVVEGLYPATALSGLVSKSGIPIPVKASDIIQTIKVSNGLVHIVSKLDVLTSDKFKVIRVEGENPSFFSRTDKTGNTYYRNRFDSLNNGSYADMVVFGHGTTGFYADYRLTELAAMKYKVYVREINDYSPSATSPTAYLQNFVFNSLQTGTTLVTLPHTVPVKTAGISAYNEIYIGDVTMPSYGTLDVQLTASSSSLPIGLDYIRLVPQP